MSKCVERAEAPVQDSLDLGHRQLPASSDRGDLTLANRVHEFAKHRSQPQREIAAVEYPLDLLVKLEQAPVGTCFLDGGDILSLQTFNQDDFLLPDLVQIAPATETSSKPALRAATSRRLQG